MNAAQLNIAIRATRNDYGTEADNPSERETIGGLADNRRMR